MTHLIVAYLIVALLGLILGSFLTVVITRYPVILQKQWHNECREFLNLPGEAAQDPLSLAQPNSRCPHCKHPIKFYHNIPLLGYLWLKGKCAQCKRPIPKQYPLVEVISALSSVIILWRFGLTDEMLGALFFTYMLIALTFIDINHQLLPDSMTLSCLWIGLLFNTIPLYTSLHNAVWGTVIGYLLLWISAWIFIKVRHKQGMGHGDFKLAATIGAWLGYEGMLNSLILAVVLGAVFSTLLLLSKKLTWHKPIPFGPYLAIAAWLSLLAGPFLLLWIK